jgi:thiol:disulfide interchange protein DsbC
MSSRVCTGLLGLLGALLPCLAPAAPSVPAQQQSPATAPASTATPDPRAQLAAKFPGARAEDLHPSPIPGVYEFAQGTEIVYLTADGKYAINGDLFDLGTNSNITEQRRRDARVHVLADLPESEMVIFSPKEPKYTVTVFTDVDCAYCRELHRQIAEYNRLGIRVRYLAYPRSGPNTESWTKAEQVWCSNDRNAALTAAKRDQPLPARVCSNNPVASEYALGKNFDLQGTPAIVMPSGEMVQGYLTPVELAHHLAKAN